MSKTLLLASGAAMAVAAVTLAPQGAQASGTKGGVPYVSIDGYWDDPIDIIVFGHKRRIYTSYTIVYDPISTNLTGFDVSLQYDHSLFEFDPSKSGPLGAFSVGGDAPPATPGSGVVPMKVLPDTGYNPGAPLPGSTLTYTDVGGILTVDYAWPDPITLTGDVNDFRLDFKVLHPTPFSLGASTFIYSPDSPGTAFTQTAASCTTVPVAPCGADTPAVGLSFHFVPEPADWMLLIMGLGLTGAAMRRRRGLAA